jgi:hypothetical protein
MMKKASMYAAAVICFLSLLVMTVSAQPETDIRREGKEVVGESQLLISEGQRIKDYKVPDRAWLTDQGQRLFKKGMDANERGRLMLTDHGRSNMGEISARFRQYGEKLIEMGKKKGELTKEEKDALMKEGDKMIEYGNLMLAKGKSMTGE